MWRVLLETVLATGIFFGLYGAADAVRFAFRRVVFSFVRSFFSSRTQQKLLRVYVWYSFETLSFGRTCALSLYVNSLSLSLVKPLNSS